MLLLLCVQKGDGPVRHFVRMGLTPDDLVRAEAEFCADSLDPGETITATHIFDAANCKAVDTYQRLYLQVCLHAAIAVANVGDYAYTFTDFCLKAMRQDVGNERIHLQEFYGNLDIAIQAMFEAWMGIRGEPHTLVHELRKFGKLHGL